MTWRDFPEARARASGAMTYFMLKCLQQAYWRPMLMIYSDRMIMWDSNVCTLVFYSAIVCFFVIPHWFCCWLLA